MKRTGNTILITGGGSGIGRGLAEAFHAAGNEVIISGRTKSKLDEVVAANPGIHGLTVDMADRKSIADFAETLARKFPQLNVLINNAGVMQNESLKKPLGDIAYETMAINLLGPMQLTSLLLDTLARNDSPVVMTVTSGLAYMPLFMTPSYCASKAAVHSYTQSLRVQLEGSPVEVLELVPPYVQTSLMGSRQANDPNAMPLGDFINEVMEILSQNPTPSEICVKRVAMQRESSYGGKAKYDETFARFTAAMREARASEVAALT
jgi:uncharacterized oxidoreductase